mgnify:CR=1 FL=1
MVTLIGLVMRGVGGTVWSGPAAAREPPSTPPYAGHQARSHLWLHSLDKPDFSNISGAFRTINLSWAGLPLPIVLCNP